MKDRDRLFLGHVLRTIDSIASFTVEGRSAFKADRKTQSAVIRQIEVIGEAVKNLSTDLTAGETTVPWRQIAGTRDRHIYAYPNVDLDSVWPMVPARALLRPAGGQ